MRKVWTLLLLGALAQAHAGTSFNGLSLNGIALNGVALNGVSLNGLTTNGLTANRLALDAQATGAITDARTATPSRVDSAEAPLLNDALKRLAAGALSRRQ